MSIDQLIALFEMTGILVVLLGGFFVVIGIEAFVAMKLITAYPTVPTSIFLLLTVFGGFSISAVSRVFIEGPLVVSIRPSDFWDVFSGIETAVPVWWLLGTMCFIWLSLLSRLTSPAKSETPS